jgi:hypothetical protein
MADDHPYAAIALYFAHVGERWDDERLEFGGLPVGRSHIGGESRQ